MTVRIEEAKLIGFPTRVSGRETQAQAYQEAFEQSRHRVYSLAFWMTDHELVAEEVAVNTFCLAFAFSAAPDAESVDRAFVATLRELMPLGQPTLQCGLCSEMVSLRRNVKRVDLERAVVQLPPTERLIFLLHDVESYDHSRIGRLLGLSREESACGLHQARLRLRELLAATH
ncbi:MAG TPA: sigma factor-like helix-turn-helix DNA-binding protein [Terriglobales bacterium]|jgi:DNA-directed RNA polymerase specialized sigma24 family protein|nr:sigma factor-like helix-turn-helix DNA-binding protein [Terriglobales bacterium]